MFIKFRYTHSFDFVLQAILVFSPLAVGCIVLDEVRHEEWSDAFIPVTVIVSGWLILMGLTIWRGTQTSNYLYARLHLGAGIDWHDASKLETLFAADQQGLWRSMSAIRQLPVADRKSSLLAAAKRAEEMANAPLEAFKAQIAKTISDARDPASLERKTYEITILIGPPAGVGNQQLEIKETAERCGKSEQDVWIFVTHHVLKDTWSSRPLGPATGLEEMLFSVTKTFARVHTVDFKTAAHDRICLPAVLFGSDSVKSAEGVVINIDWWDQGLCDCIAEHFRTVLKSQWVSVNAVPLSKD